MSTSWPKVIRDPVHNIIAFEDNDCDKLLLDLINAREFQRLRRIHQLGMSELVFPGANYTRFAHCIGVMHIARRMLDRICRLVGNQVTKEHRTAVLVAALLHDIGHGPFSHAFERVTGKKHEAWTIEIIRSDTTEVGKRLRKFDPQFPDVLASFFDQSDAHATGNIPLFLTQLVASQLDADRFDFLLWDSHATGTRYGLFDLDWLIAQLTFDSTHNRLCVGRKALDAAEAYIFARHHMYRAVYFHKTVRAAEVMLKLCLRRFKELLKTPDGEAAKAGIVPQVPSDIRNAFESAPTLERYLALDDSSLTQFVAACRDSADTVLRGLGTGIFERKLYKAVDVTDLDGAQSGDFRNRAEGELKKRDLPGEYYFVSDTASDTPYKPYDPDDDRPESQIYVEMDNSSSKEISRLSGALVELRKEYKLVRYYFPVEIREQIERIHDEIRQKESPK